MHHFLTGLPDVTQDTVRPAAGEQSSNSGLATLRREAFVAHWLADFARCTRRCMRLRRRQRSCRLAGHQRRKCFSLLAIPGDRGVPWLRWVRRSRLRLGLYDRRVAT